NDYKVTSTSEGMDALGQVSIMVQYNNRTFHGMGLATDIIRSSARALVHVANDVRRSEEVAKLRKNNLNAASNIDKGAI
ncbi:MAG: 2-isopropylmalate synthase, partial [Gammaproteobacteria bacterium]|nr:2-isopropylmalate synthase [Gammaproteobacteria bacterium]